MRNPRVTMLSLLLVVAVVACESPTDAEDQAAIPEFDPPLAPSGLSTAVVSSAQIDLSWTDGSVNELSFGVERREGQTGDWDEIDTADRDDTTFSDDDVTAETEFCYRVRAINPWGESSYTNTSCGTTPA
ncbi:MAG: fibronectin type III domain-containing protein [Gammaproteobacteria bacterium]